MRCVERLAAVIDLILRYHPFGLKVLKGEVVPTTDELSEIVRTISAADESGIHATSNFRMFEQERRVISADALMEPVEMAGGWSVIADVIRAYAKMFPETWEMVRLHTEWVEPGGHSKMLGESAVNRIAARFGVSAETVRLKRSRALYQIAKAAMTTDRDGFLRLLP
jgi:hypothetical protein